jgi:hypothetical protein
LWAARTLEYYTAYTLQGDLYRKATRKAKLQSWMTFVNNIQPDKQWTFHSLVKFLHKDVSKDIPPLKTDSGFMVNNL